MSSFAENAAAVVGILGAVGAAVAWIYAKIEARFAEIDKQLVECERRERASLERRGKQLAVIELFWAELKRIAPDTKIFTRAEKLLKEARTELDTDRDTDVAS